MLSKKSNARLVFVKCHIPLPRIYFVFPNQNLMSDNTSDEKSDKRQALLEVAERLFAQQGFEAVSVRQLAKEAGTNVSMVSYYFESKEGLFQELIASKFPYTRGLLEALAANKELSPWEKLSRTVDIYLDKFFEKRAFHCIIMREMSLAQRPDHVKVITDNMSKNMQIIRGFITDGQEKGLFRYVDADFAIIMMFGALTSYINNSALICKVMNETAVENIFSDANKARFKGQLKAMLQAHLVRGATNDDKDI